MIGQGDPVALEFEESQLARRYPVVVGLAHLLEPGELPKAFDGLSILEYQEDTEAGWAGLIARRRPSAAASTYR